MAITVNNLILEVSFLHRQFFRREAPPDLIENYLRAHSDLPEIAKATVNELRTVRIIVEKKLDALGIEPWLRSGPERHLLTRKLMLIAYLAECDAAHPQFRQAVSGRIRSLMLLCQSAAHAAVQLLRGRLQKALHGLL